MVNYQLGKVYKIVGNGKIYIGSTCERLLCQRLSGHIRAYKNYQKGSHNNMASFQCITDPNHYIELLELCPCDSKDELHKCERKYIEQLECINKYIPTRTHKEYYEDNKEQRKEQYKEYYQDNKEHRKEYLLANKEHINELQRLRRLKNKQIIN